MAVTMFETVVEAARANTDRGFEGRYGEKTAGDTVWR
jgi:hypothetical protein